MSHVKTFFTPKWGQALRQLRESRDLSERDVAETLKISHVSISHYETGQTPVSQPILYSLLDCYGYTLLEFIAELDKIK